MNSTWIADRMAHIEASGIRRAFELARSLKDPINLSIGLPDFDVPAPAKASAIQAIQDGHNAYTLTLGLTEFRDRLQQQVSARYGHADRQVIVTAGTAGGLMLGLCATVNPGDEVVVFDPYFIMYNNLIALAGGRTVLVDTYPDFRFDTGRVAEVLTPRTKVVILNSPGNPTGVVATPQEMASLARLCQDRGILLLSDEVYSRFSYDGECASPATSNPDTLVVDGLSKSHGMTGWRLGYAHGPSALIQEMAKLQQFSYICAPSPAQWGGLAALDVDLSPQVDAYRRKRDAVVQALDGLYPMARPQGAFYAFLQVPSRYETATRFAAEAIQHNLIVIPGSVFSRHDTHIRISYAVDDRTLQRGLDVLRQMAS